MKKFENSTCRKLYRHFTLFRQNKKRKKKRKKDFLLPVHYELLWLSGAPAVNELRGDPYATCSRMCAKKHRPRYSPPPNKERISLTTTTRMSKSLSSPSGMKLWGFALAIYVRPPQAAVAAATVAAMDEFWVSSQTRSIAPAPTHTPPPFTFTHPSTLVLG